MPQLKWPELKWFKVYLPKERRLPILAAGLALAGIGIYFLFYAPLLGKLRVQGRECLRLENEVTQARSQIALLKREGGARLIAEEEASLAVNEITRKGRLNGINFLSITPKPVESPPDLPARVLPVEMEIESNYELLGRFLGILDELETSLATVAELSVTAKTEDAARLNARLKIHLCLRD